MEGIAVVSDPVLVWDDVAWVARMILAPLEVAHLTAWKNLCWWA